MKGYSAFLEGEWPFPPLSHPQYLRALNPAIAMVQGENCFFLSVLAGLVLNSSDQVLGHRHGPSPPGERWLA